MADIRKPKLTKAQWSLLADIAAGDETVHESYAPAVKLVTLALAEWRHTKYGGARLTITDAGRVLSRAHP